MSSIAERSKLWGHLVLVTGSLNGRRVIGHLREMRSPWMARSSESGKGYWPVGSLLLLRLFRERAEMAEWEASLELVVTALGSGMWSNQTDGCGRGGISLPGCLVS